jgi:hypothetical protein
VGPSVARGAHGGSGGGDLAAEGRARGRWRRLEGQEVAWRCLITWGGAVLGGEAAQRLRE